MYESSLSHSPNFWHRPISVGIAPVTRLDCNQSCPVTKKGCMDEQRQCWVVQKQANKQQRSNEKKEVTRTQARYATQLSRNSSQQAILKKIQLVWNKRKKERWDKNSQIVNLLTAKSLTSLMLQEKATYLTLSTFPIPTEWVPRGHFYQTAMRLDRLNVFNKWY